MKAFNSKEEFEAELNKISQRMCQCNFVEIVGYLAFTACILEAKGILNSIEHNAVKSMFSGGGESDV